MFSLKNSGKLATAILFATLFTLNYANAEVDTTGRAYNAVRKVTSMCLGNQVTIPSAPGLAFFWSQVGSGPMPSAYDVCSCFHRSISLNAAKTTALCDADQVYDSCLILSGAEPLGAPVFSNPSTPSTGAIAGCFL